MSSEIGRYKVEKPISLKDGPLSWWKAYLNLSTMARRYSNLGIVATSVPSEYLAGMTVNARRTALKPANVEKLVFLYSNLEVPHLDYKR